MGPVRLPFNGGASGINYPLPDSLPDPSSLPTRPDEMRTEGFREILLPLAGGIQDDTVVHVGVVFNIPVGGGSLTLLLPTLDGGLAYEQFSRDGVSKVVVVPLTERGVWIYHIDPLLKGEFVLATSN